MSIRALLFVSAAALLAACAGSDRIHHVNIGSYTGADRDSANRSGGVPLLVAGLPTAGQDRAAVAASAADAMTGAPSGPIVRFMPANGPAHGSPYFVALRFGDDRAPARLCERPDENAGAGSAYGMAFCAGDVALSTLAGDLGANPPGSPGFRAGLATAASQLMPFENPDLGDCDEGACN